MDIVNKFLLVTRQVKYKDYLEIRPAIECIDGFMMSVQASSMHYCTPRENQGPYSEVEVGYPSERPTKDWESYFEGTWQAIGIVGTIKRVWEDRSSFKYALRTGLSNKSWWYFKRLVEGILLDNATNSVYAYVPINLVISLIESHGGMKMKIEEHLIPPTFEQLGEWEAQGGCEAACEHGCWVESDGHCEHGKPSWLLELGLI